MQGWVDYYRLLQVHYLAEPEVIESAYKRLARKYHPDVNKSLDSESVMKLINEAHEVLTDTVKRRKYHSEWETRSREAAKGSNEESSRMDDVEYVSAGAVLDKYFSNIMDRNFEGAYELISAADKRNICFEDFLQWQGTVSKIFKLKLFECSADKRERNVKIAGSLYEEAMDFIVAVSEYNTVMDRLEKDIFVKKVVLEKEDWRIYMGYKSVRPFIAKFENLTNLLTAKSVVNELVESYNSVDILTGLLNKKGFIELAEREILRQNRYGNTFTLMMCELNPFRLIGSNKGGDAKDMAVVWLSKILANGFRKLDAIGRWEETAFVVLLPETGLQGGIKAAQKIIKILEAEKFIYNNKPYSLTMSFGFDEFGNSLEYTLKNLIHYTAAAREHGGNSIASLNGAL